MALFLLFWLLLGLLALGPAAFIYVDRTKKSSKSSLIKVDPSYYPTISIIVPTYNESSIIHLKLLNLSRLNYPDDLTEIVLVDSNSSDNTVEIARRFLEEKPQMKFKILVEKERKGKSHALNYALNYCNGEVVIVSDADCFWPPDILKKSVPFMADQKVGAVGGPKIILNPDESWVTRLEQGFLKLANAMRLDESRDGSTPFFEGGFSAFKKGFFDKFDPYATGSDDCGTVINVVEKNFRAIIVSEAEFYSPFPKSFKTRLNVKLRRANQLVKVFTNYLNLFIKGKLKTSKKTIIPNITLYLFSPSALVVFLALTLYFSYYVPFILLLLLLLIIPKVRFFAYEALESNLLLFLAIFGVATNRNFSIWKQPDDRKGIDKEKLNRLDLI